MAVKNLLASSIICVCALPALCHAALGEQFAPQLQAGAKMRAAAQPAQAAQAAQPASGYAIHEYQTAASTTVREYAGADGIVFAVAWQGPALPAITELFGKYFDRYQEAMRGTRRHASVRQTDLVVQSSGRVGAFFGKAYLPQLLPQGVTPDELR